MSEEENKAPAPEGAEESPDVLIVETDTEAAEGSLKGAVKKLRDELKACEKERQEYLAGWQRAKADFINARNEEERARKEFASYATESVMRGLLPVLDNFERALKDTAARDAASEAWRSGIELIHEQMKELLKRYGVSAFAPSEGERFDPARHETVGTVPARTEEEDGLVREVAEKGYIMKSKVIRPARVRIAVFQKEK